MNLNIDNIPLVLTIAGSDSSSGAGIQADLKTFMAHHVYGAVVITAITAQNTQAVRSVLVTPWLLVKEQLDAVLEDLKITYIKIGMLGNVSLISNLANYFQSKPQYKLIIDPVMISKSGYPLINDEAIASLVTNLLPLAYLITPNLFEAEKILNMKACNYPSIRTLLFNFIKLNCENVLLKGGHVDINQKHVTDWLMVDQKTYPFVSQRHSNKFTHGTGCSLSSAICANLASGNQLKTAVQKAITYVNHGIQSGFVIGKGTNPINHFENLD